MQGENKLAQLAGSDSPKAQFLWLQQKFRKHHTAAQVAKSCNVSQSTVDAWLMRLNAVITYDLAIRPRPQWQRELEAEAAQADDEFGICPHDPLAHYKNG